MIKSGVMYALSILSNSIFVVLVAAVACSTSVPANIAPSETLPKIDGSNSGKCNVVFKHQVYQLPAQSRFINIEWTTVTFHGLENFRRTGSGILTLPDGSVVNDAVSPYKATEPGLYIIRYDCSISVGAGMHIATDSTIIK